MVRKKTILSTLLSHKRNYMGTHETYFLSRTGFRTVYGLQITFFISSHYFRPLCRHFIRYIFYTCYFHAYSGILGFHTLFLDIATFLLSVFITFISAYFFTISDKLKKQSFWIFLIVCLALCFFFFSIREI